MIFLFIFAINLVVLWRKTGSFDSEFMLSIIDEIGSAIKSSYHWIDITRQYVLVMDNAGGHDSRKAIEEYT